MEERRQGSLGGSADRGIAVACDSLYKVYGGTVALGGVDLAIRAGEVHALVGENGAGKSTCLGAIAGRVKPTGGVVRVFDQPLDAGDPRSMRRRGVAAVYQELTIIPALTPQANVFLADPITHRGLLSEREMRARYEEMCERYGLPVSPSVPAGTLSVADQQVIEILRALAGDVKILLLDEPTASLSLDERSALLRLIASFRDEGITTVLVSHNLDEVLEISDSISVFREGRLVVTRPRAECTKAGLISDMLAERAMAALGSEALGASHRPRSAARAGSPILQAAGVTISGRVEGVDLELRAGEILGIGGLVGSGRTSLLRALAGAEPTATGRLWIRGKEVPWPHTPRRARRLGLALIPEDRKGQGLALGMSSADNVAMSGFGKIAHAGLVRPGAVRAGTSADMAAMAIRKPQFSMEARQLSGGNQQKLLFARWRFEQPLVLLADEPTRGVDLGAKADILDRLQATLRSTEMGILLVSSELEEVVAMSDRVLVLSGGRPQAMLDGEDEPIAVGSIVRHAFEAVA